MINYSLHFTRMQLLGSLIGRLESGQQVEDSEIRCALTAVQWSALKQDLKPQGMPTISKKVREDFFQYSQLLAWGDRLEKAEVAGRRSSCPKLIRTGPISRYSASSENT